MNETPVNSTSNASNSASCEGDSSAPIRSQIRNLQAYLKERQRHRAKYYGLPVYSVSSSTLNIHGCSSGSICIAPQLHDMFNNSKLEVKIEKMGENNPISDFLKNNENNISWPPSKYGYTLHKQYPELTGSSLMNDNKSIAPPCNLHYEDMHDNNKLLNVNGDPQYVSMSRSPLVHDCHPHICREVRKKSTSCLSKTISPDFRVIMNCLFQVMLSATYQIFLVILQIVPFIELLPAIYQFVNKNILDLKGPSHEEKGLIGKTCIFFVQMTVILLTCLFILCAILFPVIAVGHALLKRLFFFI